MLGADVKAVDKHGSTPLHVISTCLRNSTNFKRTEADESDEEDTDEIHNTMAIELSEDDFAYWPVCFYSPAPNLTADLIRFLVCKGGNIYAKNSMGCTPLSLVRDPDLMADMVYLTRETLLLLFEAVCIADDLTCCNSFQRVAANADLGRYIVGFL